MPVSEVGKQKLAEAREEILRAKYGEEYDEKVAASEEAMARVRRVPGEVEAPELLPPPEPEARVAPEPKAEPEAKAEPKAAAKAPEAAKPEK